MCWHCLFFCSGMLSACCRVLQQHPDLLTEQGGEAWWKGACMCSGCSRLTLRRETKCSEIRVSVCVRMRVCRPGGQWECWVGLGVCVAGPLGLFIVILSGFPSLCPHPPPVLFSPHVHYLPTHSWLSLVPLRSFWDTVSHTLTLASVLPKHIRTHASGVCNQSQ